MTAQPPRKNWFVCLWS